MKRVFVLFCAVILGIGIGFFLFSHRNPGAEKTQAQTDSITPIPTAQSNSTASISGSGGGISSNLNTTQGTPSPFPTPPNALNYTPLPVHSPSLDIQELSLTANRNAAQVDDYITFTATIKNIATYDKTIYNLCFQSSDGNFGCIWGVKLTPGQTYTFQNAGMWTTGGTKSVWITWSQDGQNFYTPVNSQTLEVSIVK